MSQPRFDVTTFGEIMLRLSVRAGQRLENAATFDVAPAGAETNVVSLLARLERKACWLGPLPKNALGRMAANQLRLAGVALDEVIWHEGGRLGTYFVEFGDPPRGIQVTYDRAGSYITSLTPEQIHWRALLDTRLLHLTGITPALSDSCREITAQAVAAARRQNIPISFDINYRQKLWSETAARATLLPLIQGVELLLCSRRDAKRIFGCEGSAPEIARSMFELSRAKHVVITVGDEGAVMWDGSGIYHQPARPTKIIDRLGAGDALAAGVIHGWLDGDPVLGLSYGVTLAALALSQLGDMVITTNAELASLAASSAVLVR